MTTSVDRFAMSVGAEQLGSDAGFAVRNPATGAVVGQAPECTPEQLDRAVASATAAFGSWRRDEPRRRGALAAAADVLTAQVDVIAPVLTAEQGKPLADARMEVLATADGLRHYAALAIPRELVRDDASARVQLVHKPLGVVAAITPWNFPVAIAGLKLGPALLTGNTVVLKPSPFTPLSTLLVGSLLQQALPPGVLNVVSGSDPLGAQLSEHPGIAKITFTGSVATGKKVAVAAAPDLKRTTLELGGNDAAIVLDDLDVDSFAEKLFWGAFINSGQVCAAIKRVYVPSVLHTRLVDALADRARAVLVGDGAVEGVQLGPLNNRPQWERVAGLLDDAMARGAHAVAGTAPPSSPGHFFAPTIVTGIEDGVRLVDEEQFGPVLPVIAYQDLDDAVARANASCFGLGGSVWSADLDRAVEVAARLDCGTAWVNTHAYPDVAVPFGGCKWSGLGAEGGTAGLLSFTQAQVLHQARS